MYSIGETAKLMGISVQTLRYYGKIQLVEPKYINPETKYRYYTEDQFHYIDRIKYLQSLGLSLEEIDLILANGTVETLLPYLEKQKRKLTREMEKIKDTISDIQWYIDYFKYSKSDSFPDIPYKLALKERYMLAVAYLPGESTSDCYIRLNKVKNRKPLKGLKYIRQYAYLLDFDYLMKKQFKPCYLGLFVKNPPHFQNEHILVIPGGEYLCFRGRILTDQWNPEITLRFFRNSQKPSIALANEYEDNLVENSRCMHEVQLLIAHHS